jgi:hypothetical protein
MLARLRLLRCSLLLPRTPSHLGVEDRIKDGAPPALGMLAAPVLSRLLLLCCLFLMRSSCTPCPAATARSTLGARAVLAVPLWSQPWTEVREMEPREWRKPQAAAALASVIGRELARVPCQAACWSPVEA